MAAALPDALARVVRRQAAQIIAQLLAADAAQRGGASLKSLTLARGVRAKAATHAVCCETLKHLSLIRDLCADAGLEASEADEPSAKRQRRDAAAGAAGRAEQPADVAAAAVYVLVYELLFGAGGSEPSAPAEAAVAAAAPALRKALRRRLRAAGATDAAALLPAHVNAAAAAAASRLRCVRVNTLRIASRDAAAASLSATLGPDVPIRPDPLLCDVLQLPAGTDLRSSPLVASGALILQGRASCLAAHALAPQPGWTVVDACAAPGNKTTHCAALMRGRGRVYAFDASQPRLARLVAASRAAGADGVITARCADFLSLDPCRPPLKHADAVLLDPSCSGSGTVLTRGDALLPSAAAAAAVDGGDGDGARVAALARFQLAALRHALRCPRARRVVYSTCSVHVAENEAVVAAALGAATAAGFALAPALPAWPRRGLRGAAGLSDAHADCLLRCDPHADGCEGFFVALFVRDAPPQPPEQQQQQRAKQKAPPPDAPPRWVGGGGGKKRRGQRAAPLFA